MSSADSLPAIALNAVSKTYPGAVQAAVTAVDLEIGEGEFFSLLGPSGCGKTTLLRMIAGFEEPSAGHIHLHGRDVTREPPNRREVNLVFQHYALFPHLSVGENVAFGLKRKRVPREEIRSRVEEALRLVELGQSVDRKPRQLSGGQQQRVALARALVNRPRALLLDEPLAALDLKLRHAMQEELKRIQAEVGITFVFVTHDQTEAMALSDRIAVMDNGRLVQVGTPRELYNRPATEFVANFIGASTTLVGRVAADGRVAVLPSQDRITLPESAPVGTEVAVAIRPERITLTPGDQPGDAAAALLGTVTDSEFLGPIAQYTVALRDGTRIRVTDSLPDTTTMPTQTGTPVVLSWPPHVAAILRNRPQPDQEAEQR